ncbi:MAG: polysaccharide pyruvyl transferase family protein [Acidaminococcaceae bacterium]
MKKIGILTWHYLENNGSALQAYALQQTINSLGYEAVIINYCCSNSISRLRKILKKNKFILMVKRKIFNSTRQNRFYDFQNNFLNMSQLFFSYHELSNINDFYDAFLCGSDQIWSPNLLDPVYCLNFVKDNKLKISYAPSVVIDNFHIEQKEIFKKCLTNINFISVRENKGADIVKKITGRDAEVVLDPTFLISSVQWTKIAVEPNLDCKYILCYMLGDNIQHRKCITQMQKKYGYKIVTLLFSKADSNFGDFIRKNDGPREFLGLIKNAEIVCTDSFHGVALSLNYGKNFVVFERFKREDIICQNDRLYNILSKLNLMDRIINSEAKLENLDMDINYKEVNILLDKEKNNSMMFLKRALK